MKIIYIGDLPPYESGGAAIIGAHLVGGLGSRGHRVCALSARTPNDSDNQDGFEHANPAVVVERYSLPFIRSAKRPDARFRKQEAQQIRSILPGIVARETPDVVISGQESVAWPVPAIASEAGVPLIQLLHGGGHAFLALCARGPEDAIAARLIRLLRHADSVIVVAQHIAETLKEFVSTPMHVIPNPVDLERFRPGPEPRVLRKSLGLPDDVTVVTHVSCLDDIKRPLDVVHSAALALKQGTPLLYLVIGDGPRRTTMQDACRRYGIEDHFRFCGWVPHVRVADYLRLSDIVLMPSAVEGLSLVYLEALATGCTVIASEIPAGHEAITHGKNGLLVPCGDIESLAALTVAAAEDGALRASLKRHARVKVRAHGLSTFLPRYERVLEATVRRKGAGGRRN